MRSFLFIRCRGCISRLQELYSTALHVIACSIGAHINDIGVQRQQTDTLATVYERRKSTADRFVEEPPAQRPGEGPAAAEASKSPNTTDAHLSAAILDALFERLSDATLFEGPQGQAAQAVQLQVGALSTCTSVFWYRIAKLWVRPLIACPLSSAMAQCLRLTFLK